MKRREFLTLLLAAVSPHPGIAQDRPTIGILTVGVPDPEEFLQAFRKGLIDRGYQEDKDIQFDVRSAEGHPDRLPALAAELVRRRVAVIIGFQTPTVTAAKQATTEIPIVMDAGDPVGMGLVASLARPGGNITGVSAATAEVAPKNLQLLQQIVPSVTRFAIFLNATDPFRKPLLEQTQSGADRLGIDLVVIPINDASELTTAFDTAANEKVGAVLVQPSLPIARIAKLALAHRLPSASPSWGFVDDGGLMSYCANYAEVWRQMSYFVAKILKGATPSELPVEQPTRFDFMINLTTAQVLGLTIPRVITAMADKVIE